MSKKTFFTFLMVLFSFRLLPAYVNLVEPWANGIDLTLRSANTYDTGLFLNIQEHNIETSGTINYGLGYNSEITTKLPLILREGKFGLGDFIFGVKYITTKKETSLTNFGGELAISLPTGDYRNALGNGGVSIFLDWLMSQKFPVGSAHFGFGFQSNSENPDKIKNGDIFFWRLGLTRNLTIAPEKMYLKNASSTIELKGQNYFNTYRAGQELVGSAHNELYLSLGVNGDLNKYPVKIALNIGLNSDVNSKLGLFTAVLFK